MRPMINSVFIGITVGILLLILLVPLKWLWRAVGIKIPKIDGMDELCQASPTSLMVYTSVLSPLVEEILFRFIPLYPFVRYGNDYLIWSVAVLASIVFGFLHGSWKHILNLGVVGIVLSGLFINLGFTSCLAAHITNNFLCSCYYLLKRNIKFSPQLS